MSHAYTPSTSTFHSTITVTDDGDLASHSAWTVADQALADNSAYLNAKLSPLISGGTLTLGGNLAITGATVSISTNFTASGNVFIGGVGKELQINSDEVIITGRVQNPTAVVQGGGSGTNIYSSTGVDHVFAPNASLSSGVIWQIGNLPSGADRNVIRFVNIDTTAVIVKDPGGTTLNTLQNSSGDVYASTYAYLSGAWHIVDYSVRP